MVKVMDSISAFVYRFFLLIACVLICVLFVSSAIQVVCRYFINSSLPWSEELARYSFVWAMMLSAASLVKSKGHAVVDFIVNHFRGPFRQIQKVAVICVILSFGILMIVEGVQLLGIVASQRSSCLHIPMWLIYISAPVCGLGICIHSLDELFDYFSPKTAETVQ